MAGSGYSVTPITAIVWLLGLLLSLLGTGLLRRVALRRQWLDVPGARSSHVRPTPSGGGSAMTLAFLLGLLVLHVAGRITDDVLIGLLGGGVLLTLIGARDDWRPLAPGFRLLAQVVAAGWVMTWLPGPVLGLVGRESLWYIPALACELLALVWFVNLYNFMDGLDGLAASEAVFIAVLAGVLCSAAGGLPDAFGLLAGCALGFLYWNSPPARIFMGDAGSYFLGFTLAALALLSVRSGDLPLACWLLLPGVFLVDATLTLLRRLLTGERWYEAHRSHAYQHVARRLGGHGAVLGGVALLNLCWLGPWAAWVAWYPETAPWTVPLALGPLLALAWWLGAGRGEWTSAVVAQDRSKSPN